MAEQKLPNVFADPGVEDFIRDACMAPLAGGGHAIDIHALECDDEVIAIFAGVADGHRFSMMFNTYTLSENSQYSPGLILMRDIIDHYAEHGYRALDLGIGIGRLQAAVLQGRRADLRQLHPAQPARQDRGAGDVRRSTAPSALVKHNPALMRAGAEAARRVAALRSCASTQPASRDRRCFVVQPTTSAGMTLGGRVSA